MPSTKVFTQTVEVAAVDLFEKKYKELCSFAKKKGYKKPKKGELLALVINNSISDVTVENYF